MLDVREIHPLTEFLRNHKAHVERIKATRRPEILTVNGRAEVVVQDAESYQAMADAYEHMQTIAAIKEGIAAAERGDMTPIEDVYAEMKSRYGIQG